MKSTKPAISLQTESGARPGRLGLAAMIIMLLAMTACGGTSAQGRGDSGAMEPRVGDYDHMVREYEQQNGPPDEGFWREVYKDAD